MLPIKDAFSLNNSILGITADADKIYAVDNCYNICVFSRKTKSLEKATTLEGNRSPLFAFSKAVGFANKHKYFALGFSNSSKGAVINLEQDISVLEPLTWQKREITRAIFSTNDTYLATGGECGRIVVYYGDNYNFLLSSMPFSDAISTIAFSEDEHYVLGASFSGGIVVVDISYEEIIERVKFDSVVEDAIFDKDNSRIFCITRDGYTILYDLEEHTILSQNQIKGAWLTLCKRIPNTDFALVGSRDNLLYLIRISNNKLVESITARHSGVTALHFHQNLLFIGYSDGFIECLDINEKKEVFLQMLEYDDIRNVTKIFYRDNIFLCTLQAYKEKLDAKWGEVLKQAIILLSKNFIDEAIDITKPFMRDSEKQQEFNTCIEQKQQIAEFIDSTEAGNYAKAYTLADNYPFIQKTLAYEKLESHWQQIFSTCQTLLMEDAALNINKAKHLLKIFSKVESKKDAIKLLLDNAGAFLEAEKLYKSNDLESYFSLCEKFAFLKETDTYKKAIYSGRRLLMQTTILDRKQHLSKAIKICQYLSKIPPIKDAAIAKLRFFRAKAAFLEACKAEDLKAAFTFAEKSRELQNLPEFKDLYGKFSIVFKQAFSFATKGEPKVVLEILQEYLAISSLKTKINTLLKAAYLREFQNNSPKKVIKDINWEATFTQFIKRYGEDTDLKKVAKELGLESTLEAAIAEFTNNPQQCSLVEPHLESLIIMDCEFNSLY